MFIICSCDCLCVSSSLVLARALLPFKSKILVASSNRYTLHNTSSNRCVVCCAKSVRQTDTDTSWTADGVAFRAFRFPRRSNQAVAVDTLCPSVGRNAGTVLRHGPILRRTRVWSTPGTRNEERDEHRQTHVGQKRE